jgi:hypothetical protein
VVFLFNGNTADVTETQKNKNAKCPLSPCESTGWDIYSKNSVVEMEKKRAFGYNESPLFDCCVSGVAIGWKHPDR